MQGARSPRRGGGVGAEGSCVHPAPFCTATLFSCRSYTITPALRSDAVARSYAREREHTQTCPPPPNQPRTCSLHARSHVRQLSRSPTGRSAHVPASRPECVAVTYARTHARSQPERRSASLSFVSGCRGCHAWRGQSCSHPPTRTPSRATRHWQARAPSPRHGPLHARRLRGCMHTRPRMDLQHTNCWEGEGKKNPTDSAERGGGGGEREKERE